MHVAATFDGVYMKIFINGLEDNSSTVSATLAIRPNTLSLAIGAQVDASGAASRYFQGAIDDARVYGRALGATEIRMLAGLTTYRITASAGVGGSISPGGTVYVVPGASQTFTITADPGYDIADVLADGSSVGARTTYPFENVTADHTIAASFTLRNSPPAQPSVVAPPNNATGVATSPSLDVTVSDLDGDNLTVTYYARPAELMLPAADFSIIVLPDAQYYTGSGNGGSPAILTSQTQWIVDSRSARNTAYVTQVGDLSDNGDRYEVEWQAADAAFRLIEDPVATGRPDGLPYGIAVGNHEQVPDGATTLYNQYFGAARFAARSYYGGHYGVNNNNHFDLFSASGMDFLAIYLELTDSPSAAVLSWADGLLKAYPSRRGIVVSHHLIDPGDPGAWSLQGQAIYDALKGDPNLFLMLCGHTTTDGKRTDAYNGNTVHTLLADYQDRPHGGDGWLRLLEFSPANDEIRVKTYSPWLIAWETDPSSQFALAYDMPATMRAPFAAIGTVTGVASGTTGSLPWPGRDPLTAYEWYVTVSDGEFTTTGSTWAFTTGSGVPPQPVANLHATQAYTGNDPAGSTTNVELAWDPTLAGTTVEIWRAGFGHYPEYDDAGGVVPTAPTTWSDPPAAGWTEVGVVAAPATSLTDLPPARDFYYYVAFVRDGYGTWSVGSGMTGGTLNYLLGDVAGRETECAGNNVVDIGDVSLLGWHYGAEAEEPDYLVCLDVGPTTDYSRYSRPVPDGVLEFEDLVLFALNYAPTGAPGVLPAASAGQRRLAAAGADAVALAVPALPKVGEAFAVTVRASGKGDLQALGLGLEYDRSVVEMVGAEAGALLGAQSAPAVVLSSKAGRVDVALLGQGAGLAGEGDLVTVSFRVLAAGDPMIQLAAVDGRDGKNQKVVVARAVSAAPAIPAATRLTGATPNPFSQTLAIAFSLATRGPVDLRVYSVDGRQVRELVHGVREPGVYSVAWDGRDDGGSAVPAGVYYARLMTGQGRFARTITYLK